MESVTQQAAARPPAAVESQGRPERTSLAFHYYLCGIQRMARDQYVAVPTQAVRYPGSGDTVHSKRFQLAWYITTVRNGNRTSSSPPLTLSPPEGLQTHLEARRGDMCQ